MKFCWCVNEVISFTKNKKQFKSDSQLNIFTAFENKSRIINIWFGLHLILTNQLVFNIFHNMHTVSALVNYKRTKAYMRIIFYFTRSVNVKRKKKKERQKERSK